MPECVQDMPIAIFRYMNHKDLGGFTKERWKGSGERRQSFSHQLDSHYWTQGSKFIFSAECTIGVVRGLMPLKHYGTMALWRYGTMELWHYGTMALWQ